MLYNSHYDLEYSEPFTSLWLAKYHNMKYIYLYIFQIQVTIKRSRKKNGRISDRYLWFVLLK
jgi:hypothetical protein